MYEKASKADFAITFGLLATIVGLLSWLMDSFEGSTRSYGLMALGVVLLALGFGLDRLEVKEKRQVNLEKLRPKLRSYLDEAMGLMAKGKKAGEAGKFKKSLNLYLSAKGSLELAETVAREFKDGEKLDELTRALTAAREGVASANYGMAFQMSERAKELYEGGKYQKAKEGYQKALELLGEANETLDLDQEEEKAKKSLQSCEKRLAGEDLDGILKEVDEREKLFDDYFSRDFLFEAREMLNEMEVAVQKGTELAEKFDFAQAMEGLNQALERIRTGKARVENTILQKLKLRTGEDQGITPLVDRIDPKLRKVAVDVAEEVEVYSGYDFRAGAVRVQYTIQNGRKTAISELRLKVLRDERLLSLVRVSPEYSLDFNEVLLGTLGPGEKRMVNLFFDPQVCGELAVDASLGYLDASGAYHTLVPERKMVVIPEPEIGKGENLNASYLNSLVEQAKSGGRRIFLIPAGLESQLAFKMVLETLEGQGLQQVWKKNKELSAGFYGRCDGEECVLLVTGSREALELYAASPVEGGLATLLTSISGAIRSRLETEGHRNISISLNIQDSVLSRSSINLGGMNIPLPASDGVQTRVDDDLEGTEYEDAEFVD